MLDSDRTEKIGKIANIIYPKQNLVIYIILTKKINKKGKKYIWYLNIFGTFLIKLLFPLNIS